MKEELSKVVSLSELKKENFNILKFYKKEEYNKIRSDLRLILESQKISQKDMRLGFIGLAQQNQELVKLNKQLTQQLQTVKSNQRRTPRKVSSGKSEAFT